MVSEGNPVRRRMRIGGLLGVAAVLAAAWGVVARGADEGDGNGKNAADQGKPPAFTAEQVRFYEEKVRPLLQSRCWKCHASGGKVKGGLRLDSREAVLQGGDLGPAVSTDQPDDSLLLRAIRYDELEMP
ncbi:MAG: c-type cytochrome domain-containing protein, partial [Isosphaeraceae bacterium]